MTNLLIVSDVHLCQLRPRMNEGGQRVLPEFIDHYATHTVGGRPWRLIINGDLFDFDHQARRISQRGPEQASLDLFEAIAREHQGLFQALGRFLDQGHEMVLLPGNHDLDLMWPSVRAAFENQVRAAMTSDEPLRIQWRDWFYLEPGRIYVEHGHQYEVDNAITGLLDPFDSRQRLRRSLGTHWITGFCPLIPEMAYHVDHTRSPLYYVPLIIKRYGWKGLWLWLRYVIFAIRTVVDARPSQGRLTERHLRLRAALAEESGVSDDTLAALDARSVRPRLASRVSTAARLHLVPAVLIPVTLTFGILSLALGSAAFGVAAGATFAVTLLFNIFISSRFHGHSERQIREAAPDVQRIVGTPIVSFGHSHEAVDEPAGDGRYLNSGTWCHRGLPYSYIKIVGDQAELCGWPAQAQPHSANYPELLPSPGEGSRSATPA